MESWNNSKVDNTCVKGICWDWSLWTTRDLLERVLFVTASPDWPTHLLILAGDTSVWFTVLFANRKIWSTLESLCTSKLSLFSSCLLFRSSSLVFSTLSFLPLRYCLPTYLSGANFDWMLVKPSALSWRELLFAPLTLPSHPVDSG